MEDVNAQGVIKKTKRKVLLVLLITFLIFSVFIYWKFFSMQGVPKGELIRTVQSPDGKYELKTYFHDGGSLSSDAARGELVNKSSHRAKTIYWNYPDQDPHIEWINNHIVKIGDQTLDVSKNQVYDWRGKEKHSKELPKQFGE
ncbi:DUF5412 domain-containing protein [Microbacteriaceae bacterium 4G12]